MPELPEVETIRLGLERTIIRSTITAVEVRLPKLWHGNVQQVLGSMVIGVRRFGKGLVIDLSNDYSIAAHVKMTGQFVYRQGRRQRNFHPKLPVTEELPNTWTHVIFSLAGNTGDATLFYNDIRQFGWLQVQPTKNVPLLPYFQALGPEPPVTSQSDKLGKPVLTEELFHKIVAKGALPIKVLLMDQKRMSGVGNIYANDALFQARIDPRRSAKTLTPAERSCLYRSLIFVLKKGLEYGGASEINFINVAGAKGFYQEHFLVYSRDTKPCQRCGTRIERIILGARGTFYCPTCQK